MLDDLDEPNTAPGMCPDCGQLADIWIANSQQYECRLCDWRGRNPNREINNDTNKQH
jgi:hypothetical protein